MGILETYVEAMGSLLKHASHDQKTHGNRYGSLMANRFGGGFRRQHYGRGRSYAKRHRELRDRLRRMDIHDFNPAKPAPDGG